jgi:hypothetical protein
VNFGVTSKALMEFRGVDASKMPLDWSCPIRCRIGELMGQDDVWWTSSDGDNFRNAFTDISTCLVEKAIPFLNGLDTDEGILALYDSGKVMGFEIDRDETRAVLLEIVGLRDQAAERLAQYAAKWPLSPASERADKFLADFKIKIELRDRIVKQS